MILGYAGWYLLIGVVFVISILQMNIVNMNAIIEYHQNDTSDMDDDDKEFFDKHADLLNKVLWFGAVILMVLLWPVLLTALTLDMWDKR